MFGHRDYLWWLFFWIIFQFSPPNQLLSRPYIWCFGVVLQLKRDNQNQQKKTMKATEPNHALEPTTLSVTFRAPSRTDRAS